MNTARSMALIASMVSSRLIFLNSKDEDKAQLLCEFFGCMPNFTLGSKLRVIETTDILPALYSARINKDVVSIIFLKIKSKNSLELFRGHITNTYNYNYFKVNCIVNERTTTGFTIPENVWIFVFVEDDHQYDLRKYGSYAKLPTEVTSITYSEHVKPSYTSIKDAFLDLGSIDEDVWSMLDDIISVLEKEGYEFTNKELNMIDDYLVSLLEMGMDYQLAIDFTVINKISYITGDEAIGALKNYKNINILTHTKKKAGKY